MANPNHCEVCGNDFDGRRKNCPYCQDDKEYKEYKVRRQSALEEEFSKSPASTTGTTGTTTTTTTTATKTTPIRTPRATTSQLAAELNRSIEKLGDVDGVLEEFRSLSAALNARMDKIELLLSNLAGQLALVSGRIQDGGRAGDGTTGRDAVPEESQGAVGGVPSSSSSTTQPIQFNFASGQESQKSTSSSSRMAGDSSSKDGVPDNGAEPDLLEEIPQPGTALSMSKFDLRRFVPASERKKALSIDCNEKLFYLLSRMLEDLGRRGYDITGLVAHISYLTWMASTGIYTTEALVGYDYEIRERARQEGMSAFCGGDTNLTNMYLGASGTKQFRHSSGQSSYARQSTSRGGGGYNNNNRQSYGRNQQGLTGWRLAASRRGICFAHAQGHQCNGCRFRHECTCGSTDHCMFNCPNRRNNQGGDNGGT